MIPIDKELQWVNVKQKPSRQIQAHSGIIKRIQNPEYIHRRGISRTLTSSKPEIYSEPWYIQNPGVFENSCIFKTKDS